MKNKIICPNCGEFNSKDKVCKSCSKNLLLNDRYLLIDILGKNIGITYLALDSNFDKKVVIKELSIKKIKKWKERDLFKREADILLSLDNDKIPKFIDYFELSIGRIKKYYTVMEFIDGITLSEEKKRKDSYMEEEIFNILEEVSEILDYLHNLRPAVIHRDIKPTNIIRRAFDNRLVLIDFGSVVDILKPEGDNTIAGTFGYMAPEQFAAMASIESDYYSLGVVLLELLTKKEPEYFIKDISLSLDRLNEFSVSRKMKNLLSFMITDNIEDRISSIEDVNRLLGKNRDSLTEEEFIDAIVSYQQSYQHLKKRKRGFLRRSNDRKFLKEYLKTLDVKEMILLEMIISLGDLKFNKNDFYKIYQNIIENENFNFKDIMEYSKLYKDNIVFQELLTSYNLLKSLLIDYNQLKIDKTVEYYKKYIINENMDRDIFNKRNELYIELEFKLLVDLFYLSGKNKKDMKSMIFLKNEDYIRKIFSTLK